MVVVALLGWTLLGGCGPAAETPEGESSDASDASDDGGTSDTSDGACAPLDDVAGGPGETVRLRNATGAAIFVGPGSCRATPFSLARVDDGSGVQWRPGDCPITCADVLENACSYCGACFGQSTIRIDPGAVWDVAWDGSTYGSTEVPSACVAAPCNSTCEHRIAAPVGALRITSQASTACTGECTCPDGAAACELTVDEAALSGSLEVEGQFTADATTFELVFG